MTTARIFDDGAIASLATALADELKLEGVFCIQVMRSPRDGDWQIIDVNPRPGGGTRMSTCVAVDFHCAWMVDLWEGQAAPLLPLLDNDYLVVRRWEEEIRRSEASQSTSTARS